MADVPLADTCVCGTSHWHRVVGPARAPTVSTSSSASLPAARALWCRKCGAIRFLYESYWQVPLDRAGEVARSVNLDEDERPTNPGTPEAKRGE
jgi:hypothetical protein